MKSITIKGTVRSNTGKQAIKQLRAKGNVPCVLYGGKENLHFETHALDFRPLVYTPHVHTVNLSIDGTDYSAVMREIQFHPVTDNIMHIDFLEIQPDKEVVMHIPVKLKGTASGIKEGGSLVHKIKKLKVSALPANLPDKVEIDITPLEIGDSVRVSDLKMESVTFLDSQNNIVVGVRTARAVIEETPVAAAPVAGAEGAAPGTVPAAPGAVPVPAAPAPAKAAEKK